MTDFPNWNIFFFNAKPKALTHSLLGAKDEITGSEQIDISTDLAVNKLNFISVAVFQLPGSV